MENYHSVKLYLGNVFRCDGQEINLIGHSLGRLHSGNVGVDENRLHSFLLQSLDSLRARVVKLAGLPDRQPPRAQHHHFPRLDNFLVFSVRQYFSAKATDRGEFGQGTVQSFLARPHRISCLSCGPHRDRGTRRKGPPGPLGPPICSG